MVSTFEAAVLVKNYGKKEKEIQRVCVAWILKLSKSWDWDWDWDCTYDGSGKLGSLAFSFQASAPTPQLYSPRFPACISLLLSQNFIRHNQVYESKLPRGYPAKRVPISCISFQKLLTRSTIIVSRSCDWFCGERARRKSNGWMIKLEAPRPTENSVILQRLLSREFQASRVQSTNSSSRLSVRQLVAERHPNGCIRFLTAYL